MDLGLFTPMGSVGTATLQGGPPMAGIPLRRLLLLGIIVLALGYVSAPAPACPFCSMQGQTLTADVSQASMVLFGTLTNAKLDPNGDLGGGSTDLVIEGVV